MTHSKWILKDTLVIFPENGIVEINEDSFWIGRRRVCGYKDVPDADVAVKNAAVVCVLMAWIRHASAVRHSSMKAAYQ